MQLELPALDHHCSWWVEPHWCQKAKREAQTTGCLGLVHGKAMQMPSKGETDERLEEGGLHPPCQNALVGKILMIIQPPVSQLEAKGIVDCCAS